MTKPNWNDAPKWAQWLAQDFNGDWYWYEKEPIIADMIIARIGEHCAASPGNLINNNWKQTLEKRPQNYSYEVSYNGKEFVATCVDSPNLDGEVLNKNTFNNAVNHPAHYNQIAGIECIDVARHFDFNLGNCLKYIWRAYHKNATIEDLQKAVWYLQDEIKMLQEKAQ